MASPGGGAYPGVLGTTLGDGTGERRRDSNMNLLKFDASGSAQARLHGKVFRGHIHESGMLSYHGFPKYDLKLICPTEFGVECQACKGGMPRIDACFVLCHSRKRWFVHVIPPVEMSRIMDECFRMGYSESDMESGNGPDILVQEGEKSLLIKSSTPPPAKVPDLGTELRSMARNSRWA